ncbi:hypothetical protein GAW62_20770 [Salmonella enterica subsp. enterica]|nr:hypothetical protein [Salmonella enterica subsp. enterica serovar Kottbus]EDC6448966.1 hypothetical protein [Salmonella enterica subsp. enterica serovar Kottbus]
MITVTISETNGHRKWSHSARTKDALTAIIRTMRKHFPQSHNFIPDGVGLGNGNYCTLGAFFNRCG